jgi:tetratricopeptide (TPR) repeat protein
MTDAGRAQPPSFARSAGLVFVTAVAVRLGHLWFLRRSPFFDVLLGDAQSYDTWARRIADGEWAGRAVFYQAPLYPYFMAVVYWLSRDLLVLRICQAIIGAGSCVLIGYAGAQLFDRRVGLTAGLLLAFYGPAVFFDALVQKSVLDLFLLCALLALIGRAVVTPAGRENWLGIGLSLGALGLTRENALILMLPIFAWIVLGSRDGSGSRLRDAGLVFAGLIIVIAPVVARNRIVGGEFVLTTVQSGPNFFIGNSPNADGTYVPLRAGRGSFEFEQADASDLAERLTQRALSPGEVSSYWFGRGLEYIRTHPREWLALEWRKITLLVNVSEVIDTESQEAHADYSPLLRLLTRVCSFGVLLTVALAGLWITWRDGPRLWLLYGMATAYALSVLAFYVVGRYRLLVVPFLVLFAAAAVVRGRRFLRAHQFSEIALAAAVLAIAATFSNWPAESPALMRAIAYQNLGTTLLEAGRAEEAAAAFTRGIEAAPQYAPPYAGLGSALKGTGRLDEAIARFQEALKLQPDFREARFNLANALASRGRLPEAVAIYEDLLRYLPDAADPSANVDVHSNFGAALVEMGQIDLGIEQFRQAVAVAPRAPIPRYNLGHALLTRGDLDEAVEVLSNAVELDRDSVQGHYELGNALLANKRFEEAARQFREVIRLSPRLAQAHNNLGIALGSMGRVIESREEFRLTLELDPGNAEARSNLRLAERDSSAPNTK